MANANSDPAALVGVIRDRCAGHAGHSNIATEMTRAEAEAAGYKRVFDDYVQEERYVPCNFLDAKGRFSRFDTLTYDEHGRPEYLSPKPVQK